MRFLKQLFSGGAPARPAMPAFNAPIRPDTPFYAIGDIHGTQKQLLAALADIAEKTENPTIICVGDYVDRGEQSADVLRTLKDHCDRFAESFICLLGNHEQMMLKFLDDPEKHGERWLRYGGLQTLASFQVGMGTKRDLTAIRDKMVDAMGEDLIDWLRNLPTRWSTGNISVVHAGADPFVPISNQTDGHLLWGHPEFEAVPRQDGVWVVHGHTIVDVPYATNGRIATDTGAYATGRLTVAYVSEGDVSFSSY